MNAKYNAWMKSLSYGAASALAVKSVSRGSKAGSRRWALVEPLEHRILFSTFNFLVNTLSPTSGSPTATSGGLVDAVNAANADTTDNAVSITFSATVFAGGGGTIQLTGLLDLQPTNIALAVTIDATSVGGVTLRGGGGASNFSAIEVDNGTANLTDLTFTNFSTNNSGGGVYNDATATLTNCTFTNNIAGEEGGGLDNEGFMTVTSCTFTNNSANYGGGLYNDATMTMSNSAISDNSLTGVGGGAGFGNEGTATLTDCTITGNTGSATGDVGGGVLNFYVLAMTDCTISGNSVAGNGGGFDDEGTLSTITNSTIGPNTAANGGGVYSDGVTTISYSTITGNTATSAGGGVARLGLGSGSVSINNSTIDSNSATGNGGGIVSNGTLTLTNSTVSNNTTAAEGGGIAALGAGVSVMDSTLSGNSATGAGGGIDLVHQALLIDSIIANTTNGGDVAGLTFSSGSLNNLIDDAATSSGLTDGVGGNIINHPALLGTLANNGGPTQTFNLSTGSPALNAGTPLALTTLAATIDGSDTTFTTASTATIFVGLYARIDNEIVLITNINGASVTVSRAQLGTAAAAHSSGASLVIATDQRNDVRSVTTPDIGAFEATPAVPTISGVSPLVGPVTGATLITITGTGFTGATGATVGGAALTSFAVVNDTTITGDTPAGSVAGQADVVVTNGTSATLAGGFTYNPVVTTSSTVLTMSSTTLTINGFGFDSNPVNDSVAFSGGVTGSISAATNNSLSIDDFSGLVAGALSVTVTVDGAGGSQTQVAMVTPAVSSNTNNLSPIATTLTIDGFGFDSNAANDSIAFSGGATGTVSTATSTTLNVTGLTGLVAGPLTAIVTVNGTSSSSAVEVAVVEQAPGINSAADTTFTVGTAGSFTVTVTGNPASTFSLTGAPGWLSIGSATGIIAGTPPNLGAGTYVFNFTVDAGNGVAPDATQAFTLTVNQAPAITSAADATFARGAAGSFTVTTTGNPAPTFSLTGAPAWLSIGGATGIIAGTPPNLGAGPYVFNFTVDAGNGVTPDATQPFTLTVNQAPAITSAMNTTFMIGTAESFTVTSTGFPVSALTELGALPAGVTFTDNGNGTATISSTTTATAGVYSLTIGAANGIAPAASQAFTLTMDEAPAITSSATDTFTTGQSGTFTVTTTGFPTGTLSQTGALPDGVTFTDNGNGTATLAGTPTIAAGGIYNLEIIAVNGVSSNASQTLTITVDQAPLITSVPSDIFEIGQSGSFTISTTGFPTAVLSETGALPAGVTFTDNQDGTATLAGTPTGAAGIYSLTIVAGNNILPNASQTFTLQVNQIPVLTNLTFTAPANSVSQGATLQFTAAGTDENGLPIALGTVTWSLDAGSVGSIDQSGLFTAGNIGAAGGSAVVRATSDGQSAIAVITVDSITQPVITVNAFAELITSGGNTGTLHVQGTENGSDANLIYTWSIVSQPSVVTSSRRNSAADISGAPLALFSINGNNGAKNTSVTFLASGAYTLQVVASNGTQSASSQVQLTVDVKPSEAHAKTQATQVSGVQAFGDAISIAGFVVSFTGPLDFISAQDTRGYRVRRQSSAPQKPSLLGQLLGEGDKNQPDTYKIGSAVYNAQTDSVTLTLAKPMPVQNGVRRVQVMGKGPHAVLDANSKPIDGNADGKAGGTFTYHLSMSVGKSITYKTSAGDTVKLSLSGPGQIVTLLPTGTNTPVIDLVDTNSATTILTGELRKGSKSPGYAVLDELNGTADATIQLGSDFHVNESNGAASV
jgi:hypothetical protein